MPQLYLGLMSGTSIDGVDAALVDFSGPHPRLLDSQTFAFPPSLTSQLHQLCAPSGNEIEQMGRADREVAKVFAEASLQLLKNNYVRPDQIKAIGSHGQTIRHIPSGQHSFSLQIGDPNTLAALTGIDVVADFRRKDIALGGQGAPLVPAFHKAVFSSPTLSRIVVNIGGIANLTYLPKGTSDDIIGYDTGPGNTLLDAWCKLHTGQDYDEKGQWAAQRSGDPELLQLLSKHPYFSQLAPKSTGREEFNLTWLQQNIDKLPRQLDPQVVQATLVMLTASTIATQVLQFRDVEQVYICGGGARNEFLVEELESELHECDFFTTDDLGVEADAVEAMAFAWLAYAHFNNIQGSIASVTGATKGAVLGTYCPGKI
ncbi:anhydro-N-acetylmuramic acid kinase [uncultured Paraglaciecola sp.]|uniref:anhydro-N-acetylmuramic acid kinase n=1 Tax=uncultured Paraglaciecola sp. TaxID=1765024 RepID=UPI00263A2B45|nr:anhydro-N-acetylmuramic acid kinase [uncultured Paraglaciecola sp.]